MFLRIAQQYLWFQSLTDSLMIKLHDLIIWHFTKDTGNQQWFQRFYFRNRILAKRQERGAGKKWRPVDFYPIHWHFLFLPELQIVQQILIMSQAWIMQDLQPIIYVWHFIMNCRRMMNNGNTEWDQCQAWPCNFIVQQSWGLLNRFSQVVDSLHSSNQPCANIKRKCQINVRLKRESKKTTLF